MGQIYLVVKNKPANRLKTNKKMKTKEQVENLIKINIASIYDPKATEREIKKIKSENENLKSIVFYLETNPREEFIEREKNRIETLIAAKEAQYKGWSSGVCPQNIDVSKRWAMFERELGLKKLKQQLEILKFILQ